MPKRKRSVTAEKIERWLKEGRGSGEGQDYKPWFTIQDVSSKGNRHRISGIRINREYHLLSNNEEAYFHVVERADEVTDIREQYPLLPQAETLTIAQELGVKHPTDPKTQHPVIMTTDFYLTIRAKDGSQQYLARTFKEVAELQNRRTIEKLEIERRYWQIKGVDWGIVTEREISQVLVANVRLMRSAYWIEADEISPAQRAYIADDLRQVITSSEQPLNLVTAEADKRLGLRAGQSLKVAYHMIITGQWVIDWYQPLDPGKPLQILNV